jgi:superfamily II DNA or RNA helicase
MQLMREYYEYFLHHNMDVHFVTVHSGGEPDVATYEALRTEINSDILYQQIISTTNSVEVCNEINKAKTAKQKRHVLIFATYHSADRAQKAMNCVGKPFDFIINDEAHYLVTEQFSYLTSDLNAKKFYSFTATMRYTKALTGNGMNNVTKFGEVIYKMVPREAIDKGMMVRPRMHIARVSQDTEDLNKEQLEKLSPNIISECFKQHQYNIKTRAKLFITATGTGMLEKIIKSYSDGGEIKTLAKQGVSVYIVASDPKIGNTIIDKTGTKQVKRGEFLKQLKKDGEDDTKDMIICHYDILTEGIDVPGISGILPFRALSKSKFIQTLGRATRIHKDDRAQMSMLTLKEMTKPYAWIIIPNLDLQGDDMEDMFREMVSELREYGFNPHEDIVITNETGGMPPTVLADIENLNELGIKEKRLKESIEELTHDFEAEQIASLSSEERLEEIFKGLN